MLFTAREWHVIAFDLRVAADSYIQSARNAAAAYDERSAMAFIGQAQDAIALATRIERMIAG